MAFKPIKHIITPDEIKKASKIGLKFINAGPSPENLLNQHFPNFDLLTFFSGISNILTPLCIGPHHMELAINSASTAEISVNFYTDNVTDEFLGLGFSRNFSIQNNELSVEHTFFRLPEMHRGKGVAKEIVKLCLQQYINMDVKKITVHAALDVGGYAWALYYFTVPDKKEIDIILERARQTLQPADFIIVKRIYNNYYAKNPNGTAFPIVKWAEIPFMKVILRASEWNGLIDLNNQEQLSNFILYATT